MTYIVPERGAKPWVVLKKASNAVYLAVAKKQFVPFQPTRSDRLA